MSYTYDIALSFATEEIELVEKIYHYLSAENLKVFFAPAPECQIVLSAENQRKVFYQIFGMESEFVALLVSRNYIVRAVPMEEANIAFSKHNNDGKVIPVYLDDTPLPLTMLDPNDKNYFRSNNPAVIASHIATKIKNEKVRIENNKKSEQNSVMHIEGNTAVKQVFIQTFNGNRSND